jgi:hypothetical protein
MAQATHKTHTHTHTHTPHHTQTHVYACMHACIYIYIYIYISQAYIYSVVPEIHTACIHAYMFTVSRSGRPLLY